MRLLSTPGRLVVPESSVCMHGWVNTTKPFRIVKDYPHISLTVQFFYQVKCVIKSLTEPSEVSLDYTHICTASRPTTHCLLYIYWLKDLLLAEYKFLINLRLEPVTSPVTFPARSASPLSSVPSCQTKWSGFIITAVGTSFVPRRTWKLDIRPRICFTRLATFTSHLTEAFLLLFCSPR